MLLQLRAENYAVIDHAVAAFGPGLNLLTGETGAGKSILVDALALLMGDKASSDVVRHGADRAVVACVFESTAGAQAVLQDCGIDPEESEIILKREIQAGGKSRVYVNNQPATVAVLRRLAPELALVHSQSETLSSFDQTQQRLLLDRFAGVETEEMAAAFDRWRLAADSLRELETDEEDRARQMELWRFEQREIEAAQLKDGEDETLNAERRILANAEKLYAAAMNAYEVLYDDAGSAETSLRAALHHLEELARYDDRFAEAVEQLRSARAVLGDVSASVRTYAGGIHSSPERLSEIEDRLALLDRLKRKYGKDLAQVIAHGDEAREKLAAMENREQTRQQLRQLLQEAARAYEDMARRLSAKRAEAAERLATLAVAEINDLALHSRFFVQVTPRQAETYWSRQGWDQVEYRIATNAGEPLKPLDQIASGGEMSRVMLALKVTVERAAGGAKKRMKALTPRTLIFDEIDIGIGGRAAEAVGRKLKTLSRSQQVICVTHLPQIAAFADQHLAIEKRERQGRTSTSVRLLNAKQRTEELARMLSGATLTETSLRHAEQMLKSSS